jgi:hypothetical protein
MAFQGKGFFIWKIRDCENGDPNSIANLAAQAGLSHVLIKIADGTYSYNVDSNGTDLVIPVVRALHARGIETYGWHYIYGDDSMGEANKAIQRIGQTGVDGYVMDVEGEYKQSGKSQSAQQFMGRLRSALPKIPIALCSYRFPSYHPQVPWQTFLQSSDYNMPQVYWEYAHNPGEQLIRAVNEFQAMTPFRPIIPVGSAYKRGSWGPTSAEMLEFMQTARTQNLQGGSFWEWSNCRLNLPEAWDAIRSFSWSGTPFPQDITAQYIAALNKHDPNLVVNLYTPTAVHVNAARTVQGTTAIRTWFHSFFSQILPNAEFTLTGFSGTGSSRHLTWTATSSSGKVNNGNDTLGLVDGKIAYHYTFFTVSA